MPSMASMSVWSNAEKLSSVGLPRPYVVWTFLDVLHVTRPTALVTPTATFTRWDTVAPPHLLRHSSAFGGAGLASEMVFPALGYAVGYVEPVKRKGP